MVLHCHSYEAWYRSSVGGEMAVRVSPMEVIIVRFKPHLLLSVIREIIVGRANHFIQLLLSSLLPPQGTLAV